MSIIDELYGWSPGLPILAYKRGEYINWCPKACHAGSMPQVVDRIGCWGGTVETYEKGFNEQPVHLAFLSIDVDHKDNPQVCLVSRVTAALPEAMVRTSTSGMGVHVFIRAETPFEYPSRVEALQAAQKLSEPYADRLVQAGVKPDIVGTNMLWVTGGKQETIQDGDYVSLPRVDVTPVALKRSVGYGQVALAEMGPMCRRVMTGLMEAGAIRKGEVCGTRHMLHVAVVEQVLEKTLGLKPIIKSRATKLNEPNCLLTIDAVELRIHSFVSNKTVFSISRRF